MGDDVDEFAGFPSDDDVYVPAVKEQYTFEDDSLPQPLVNTISSDGDVYETSSGDVVSPDVSSTTTTSFSPPIVQTVNEAYNGAVRLIEDAMATLEHVPPEIVESEPVRKTMEITQQISRDLAQNIVDGEHPLDSGNVQQQSSSEPINEGAAQETHEEIFPESGIKYYVNLAVAKAMSSLKNVGSTAMSGLKNVGSALWYTTKKACTAAGILMLASATLHWHAASDYALPPLKWAAKWGVYGINRGHDFIHDVIQSGAPPPRDYAEPIDFPPYADPSFRTSIYKYLEEYPPYAFDEFMNIDADSADIDRVAAGLYWGRNPFRPDEILPPLPYDAINTSKVLDQVLLDQKEIYETRKRFAETYPTQENIDLMKEAEVIWNATKATQDLMNLTRTKQPVSEEEYQHLLNKWMKLKDATSVFHWTNEQIASVDTNAIPLMLHAAEMAWLAYAPDINRQTSLTNFEVLYDRTRKPVHYPVGFISYSNATKAIDIAFKGTENFADFMADAKSFLKMEITEVPVDRLPGGIYKTRKLPIPLTVAYGFGERFMNIAPDLFPDIEEFMRRYPKAQLIFEGHSLGGAIATLAATVTKELYPKKKVMFYAFEAPRVFSTSTVEAIMHNNVLSSLDLYGIRTSTPKDVVPYVPTNYMDFAHLGTNVQLPNAPGHVAFAHKMGNIILALLKFLSSPLDSIMHYSEGRGYISIHSPSRKRIRRK